jgi:response regulator RpfG family c-di-GMP phosphodiesterase/tRNA A-37 threonylcarbamoyl transferase component Bud32
MTGMPAKSQNGTLWLPAEYLRLSPAQSIFRQLRQSALISDEDWQGVPANVQDELSACGQLEELLSLLVEHGLLTEFQAGRIQVGKATELLLGNYRILDRIGSGGMGIVYRAEHVCMRRQVAIKVLRHHRDDSSGLVHRFYCEMRTVAQLQHPNIVAAIDAGQMNDPRTDSVIHYLVMEYVPGQNLEDLIKEQGPLAPALACDLIHQIASGLEEAHHHQLVHRDIKPSNILVTPQGQAKLLDFGLARRFDNTVTEPGTFLGTVEFMAPEQVRDAHSVDIRADIYGLGGTLFWCLTARSPFPSRGNTIQELTARLTQEAPSIRAWRSDLPLELDAVIARMMACRLEDRYATPQAVMNALLVFLKPDSDFRLEPERLDPASVHLVRGPLGHDEGQRLTRILIADDDPSIRTFCRYALEAEGLCCEEAGDGLGAWSLLRERPFDLLLLDWAMPGLTGLELCRKVRENPPAANIKIILCSGHGTPDDVDQVLAAGADEYLNKPFSVVQLVARIKAALRLKEAQDRSDLLNRHLLAVNHELEQNINARDSDLIHARNALVLALAKLVEYRDSETGAHLMRLQRYCRCLAEEAARTPHFVNQIDPNFIEMLECCAPLHDIGKVGLPDHILLKPGRLDPDERIIMQAHTIIGAETLRTVATQHGSAMAFLQMAIDIAHYHHERYDGRGYPAKLAGTDIPLSARLVTLGDVYDALRSRRVYKPALSHAATMQVMTEASSGQFDPALLQAFHRCAPQFERIYRELAD